VRRMSEKYYCEGCHQEFPEDEFDEELCRECVKGAKEQADYRAWVNRGG
jgi:rRNA maturation endonuclease Nob1